MKPIPSSVSDLDQINFHGSALESDEQEFECFLRRNIEHSGPTTVWTGGIILAGLCVIGLMIGAFFLLPWGAIWNMVSNIGWNGTLIVCTMIAGFALAWIKHERTKKRGGYKPSTPPAVFITIHTTSTANN